MNNLERKQMLERESAAVERLNSILGKPSSSAASCSTAWRSVLRDPPSPDKHYLYKREASHTPMVIKYYSDIGFGYMRGVASATWCEIPQ